MEQIELNTELFRKRLFENPTEEFVGALGKSDIQKYYSTDDPIDKAFAVVSSRRLYVKGKYYNVTRNNNNPKKYFYKKNKKNLKDRTYTYYSLKGVTNIETRSNMLKYIMLWFCSVLMLICAIIMLICGSSIENFLGGMVGFLGIFGLCVTIYLILYNILVMPELLSVLIIWFGNNGIALSYKWNSSQETYQFRDKLRIAVDDAENATTNAVNTASGSVSSADELAKYAQLYKDGLITEQEYSREKERILSH